MVGQGDLGPFELGHPQTELRRQLVAAVLNGTKIATAGLAEHHTPIGPDPLPKIGDQFVLHDFDDHPVAIVEITEVNVVPAGSIDLAFARDEGEGFESVEEWRVAHARFFERGITARTGIVAQRFRVVKRL